MTNPLNCGRINTINFKGVSYLAKIKCPGWTCGSTDVVPIDTKKKFSVGKAVVGNTIGFIAAGPVGGVVGAATGIKGKNGKTKFVCQKCGKVFEKKL